jgi:hypothetical protein
MIYLKLLPILGKGELLHDAFLYQAQKINENNFGMEGI